MDKQRGGASKHPPQPLHTFQPASLMHIWPIFCREKHTKKSRMNHKVFKTYICNFEKSWWGTGGRCYSAEQKSLLLIRRKQFIPYMLICCTEIRGILTIICNICSHIEWLLRKLDRWALLSQIHSVYAWRRRNPMRGSKARTFGSGRGIWLLHKDSSSTPAKKKSFFLK